MMRAEAVLLCFFISFYSMHLENTDAAAISLEDSANSNGIWFQRGSLRMRRSTSDMGSDAVSVDEDSYDGENTTLGEGDAEDCIQVYQCLDNSEAFQDFSDILGQFDVVEVADMTDVWCNAPPHTCREDEDVCHSELDLKELKFYEDVMGYVCRHRAGYKKAAKCLADVGPLGPHFQECHDTARNRLALETPEMNMVVMADYYLQCIEEVIVGLPATCPDVSKNLLRSTIRFATMGQLALMGH